MKLAAIVRWKPLSRKTRRGERDRVVKPLRKKKKRRVMVKVVMREGISGF